ncbi:MAG: hypothetical protein RIQ52_272 [Pseudomonadota bacterium]|jgi:hypothetical protein
MRGLAAFIMRGQNQSILVQVGFACLSFVMPLASLFSSATMALVMLRQGVMAAVPVFVASCVLVTGFGMVTTGNLELSLMYGVALWLPTAIIAWVLRDTRDLSLSLEVTALFGMAGIGLFYLLVDQPGDYWSQRMAGLMQPLLDMNADADPQTQLLMKQGMERVGHYVTGLMASGAVITLVMTLLIGRWWQSLLFNPGGFRDEYLGLRLSRRAGVAAIAAMLVGLTGGLAGFAEVVVNAGLVLFALYLFVGLAVAHALLSARSSQRFWLIGLYVLLFIIPHLMVPLALLGLSDSWFDWRRRVTAGTH